HGASDVYVMAASTKSIPYYIVCVRTKQNDSELIKNLEVKVGHRDNMIRAYRAIGVWRRAAAQVAVSIKADNRSWYPKGTHHPLDSRIGYNLTKRRSEHRPLVVVALRTFFPRQLLHAAQRRRDVEPHHRHHATILGAHNGLWIAGLAGGSAWLRKQSQRDGPETKQNADQEPEFEEC